MAEMTKGEGGFRSGAQRHGRNDEEGVGPGPGLGLRNLGGETLPGEGERAGGIDEGTGGWERAGRIDEGTAPLRS